MADRDKGIARGTRVRDLWALRLQRLRTRVSYDSDTETDTQSHFFSSQSEGEASASDESARSRKHRGKKIDGTLLLREPVLVADLHRWASDGELPYYHASNNVPLSMRERLLAVYQELLEPKLLGKPEKLHNHVLGLMRSFATEFGMALPPINHPLILYRWMRKLALPIEVFAATSRLARLTDPRKGQTQASGIGSSYRRIRHAGELEGPAKVFYERAAELAGLSVEAMVMAVFQIEGRMHKLEEKARKGV
ncbi:hypothetical protein LTR48_004050 [Friedmanniomyces endolithicus]|nr:hypothetical protein LTR48_004050 [Friedmanniomyces endolithicus]